VLVVYSFYVKKNITYYIPTVKERDGEKIFKKVLHAARNM